MSLKPWDPGYVPPARKSQEELDAERRERCSQGGLATSENRYRILNGEEPQYGQVATNFDTAPGARNPRKGVRGIPDPNSPNSVRIGRRTSERLKPQEIELVNNFVKHYLRLFDAPQAYVMAGGKLKSASTKGYEMLRWPAVQERMERALAELEEEQLLTRKDVLVGLRREANYHGHDSSHGARIRAWMGLARIKKMDVQVTENLHTVRGGVMLIPVGPQTDTIDGWAQVVSEDQAKLKEEVRK